jgi:hypothetical protein
MRDNSPPLGGGFGHSGHEAPLVNEKNNIDKTKTEYKIVWDPKRMVWKANAARRDIIVRPLRIA